MNALERGEVAPLHGWTAGELKAKKLASARAGARTALKIAADWLQSVGAPAAEVEALRAAWRALPPP